MTWLIESAPEAGRLSVVALGAIVLLTAIVMWVRWLVETRREKRAREVLLWVEHEERVREVSVLGLAALELLDADDKEGEEAVRSALGDAFREMDHEFVLRLARQIEKPGTGLARYVRVSWLSENVKRNYYEAIADIQRDYHDVISKPRSREIEHLEQELNRLFIRVSASIVWKTVTTVVAVYRIIR